MLISITETGVADVVETVIVDTSDPPAARVGVEGLIVITGLGNGHVWPDWQDCSVKSITPKNPLRLVRLIWKLPEEPSGILMLPGPVDMAKLAIGAMIWVEFMIEPLVPVTVTV